MRLKPMLALLGAVFTVTGCRFRNPLPEGPLPPNTVLLSQMMRELSAQPGFTESVLREIEGDSQGKRGPALLTPKLADELRKRILGKDWAGLDRFPGWTMRAINPAVSVVNHVVARRSSSSAEVSALLDIAPYALDREA